MEEGEVMGGGGTKQRERKAVEREASGVIEKGFDSPCAPPMKITTLSYGYTAQHSPGRLDGKHQRLMALCLTFLRDSHDYSTRLEH